MTGRQRTDPDWISLSEAGRILGVSDATVRRWSDAGRLRVYTTPGGHRRFSRRSLMRLLPADRRRRPSLVDAGLTPARITRTYRRTGTAIGTSLPWVMDLTDEQRLMFRERGHRVASDLLQYLDASQPEAADHHLREAASAAARYGEVAADAGLSLSQTVEAFLRFRAPFHHELAIAAKRRGFDASETSALLETAESAMDRLLVATMTGHSLAAGRREAAIAPRVSRTVGR